MNESLPTRSLPAFSVLSQFSAQALTPLNSSLRLSTARSPFRTTAMILLHLYLSLLASIGAARFIPIPREEGILVGSPWHQPRNIVEEPGLSKRADGEQFSYTDLLLGGHTPIPQPSSATASQHHGHGLFHDQSDALQGEQGMSHHHVFARDPVGFHPSQRQHYAQVAPLSHDMHNQPYGQGTSEFSGSHHQTYVQDSAGSQDSHNQHQPSTQDPSRSHGSYWHPYGQGSSENSHLQQQSHVHEPHGSSSLQAYPDVESSPELDDLVKQHLEHYDLSRLSHTQIGEQQSQTHAGLGLPGSHHHQPSAGEQPALIPHKKSSPEENVSGEASDCGPAVKSKRRASPKKRRAPTPLEKAPELFATRKQEKIALIYYLRAEEVVATRNQGLFDLSEEDEKAMGNDGKNFYEWIRSRQGGRICTTKKKKRTHSSVGDEVLIKSMRVKITKIRYGETSHRSGLSWTIEDVKELERLARGPFQGTVAQPNTKDIEKIVEDSWTRDRKALFQLYLNPWGKKPVDFILENHPFLQSLFPPPFPPQFHQ